MVRGYVGEFGKPLSPDTISPFRWTRGFLVWSVYSVLMYVNMFFFFITWVYLLFTFIYYLFIYDVLPSNEVFIGW